MPSFLSASTPVWLFRALAVIALAACLLWVKSRVDMSYEVGALKDKVSAYTYMFQHEKDRRVEAEKYALAQHDALLEEQKKITHDAKDAAKQAAAAVSKDAACNYSADVVSMLNRARGYTP